MEKLGEGAFCMAGTGMRKLHLLVTDAETGEPITVYGTKLDCETETLMLVFEKESDGQPAIAAVGSGLEGWEAENRRQAPIWGLMALMDRLCAGTPEERSSGLVEACDGFAKMLMHKLDGKTAAWLLMQMAEGVARETIEGEEEPNEYRN